MQSEVERCRNGDEQQLLLLVAKQSKRAETDAGADAGAGWSCYCHCSCFCFVADVDDDKRNLQQSAPAGLTHTKALSTFSTKCSEK